MTFSETETTSRIRKYWDKKGRLNLWAGAIANNGLQQHQQRQAKNQEAEDSYVRRKAWEECPGASTVSDDMGHTILGDVTNPTPIVIHSTQPQSNGLVKVLAGAAIAAGLLGIPAAGVIGYGVSQWAAEKTDSKPVATEDTSLDIGLGKFEDLKIE